MKRLLATLVLLTAVATAACSSSDPTETSDPPATTTTTTSTDTTLSPDTTSSTTTSDPPPSTTAPSTTVTPSDGPPACVGDDWIEFDTGPFTFRTPPDLFDQNPQGIDSLVGRYVGGGLEITFDYGWYSPGIDDLERFGATIDPIDLGDVVGSFASVSGTAADFGSEHVTHLRVDQIPNVDPSNALWMGINYDDVELTATAECIVSTTRFA